ncbi:RNA polymerase subunit sigma, partial [filamentous cyanobacterium CCP5]
MSPSITTPWPTQIAADTPSCTPDRLSNYDLVLACQQTLRPDRAAFSELLRRYQSHVEKLLYHLAPDWS